MKALPKFLAGLVVFGLTITGAFAQEDDETAEGGGEAVGQANSTYYNPIFPGFHPDPSCIFVPEWDDTFFCAASSFNAFPGIPIHASKDLKNWRLIGMFVDAVVPLWWLSELVRFGLAST